MTHSFLLLTIIASACAPSSDSFQTEKLASNDCLSKITQSLKTIDEKEDAEAANLDPEQSSVRSGNETLILKGDPKRIVFLLHGFIASPFEVRPLGAALNEEGYTVIMPLIAGYGRSTNVANQTTSETWLAVTKSQILASLQCGNKIDVIGFSLGALLETKIILENEAIQAKLKSLTLISPALKIKGDSFLSTGSSLFQVFNPTPRVSTLAALARQIGNHDLDIPEKNPDFYNTELPLNQVKALSRLSNALDFSMFSHLNIPLKIIYSEADHTVDGAGAFQAVSEYKPDTQILTISASENVPHQVLLSGTPAVFNQIKSEIDQSL